MVSLMGDISHTHARNLITHTRSQCCRGTGFHHIRSLGAILYEVSLPTCMSLPGSLEDCFHEYCRDAQRTAQRVKELRRYEEGTGGLGGGAELVEYQANAMSVTSYLGR